MPTHQKADSQNLSQKNQDIFKVYGALDTDAKLALLYYIYEKMGDSITPAAPTAAEPELAPMLMGDFYTLSEDEQLNVMRDIAAGKDTEYSRAYGSLTANNQLVVWYAWAQSMGDTVVDMPDDYEATDAINRALGQIEHLDFQDQISVLREIATNMGYSDVQAIPTQAETGKTSSL